MLTIPLASEKSAQKLRSVIPGIYNMVAKNAINFARCIGPSLQILDVNYEIKREVMAHEYPNAPKCRN